jgi:indolepyruvate ferredoxin oxidoreductase alpha subunit
LSIFNIVAINEDACNGCGICYEQFACPAIGRREDGIAYIQADLCNGNGSCIQVCPTQAIYRPKREPVGAEK